MITIQQIQKDIGATIIRIDTEISPEETGKLNREKKHLDFLKTCKEYMENNPKEDYLLSEQKRITQLLFSIQKGFDSWRKQPYNVGMDLKQLQTKYNALMEVKKHKYHLRTVQYLLNEPIL